MTYKEFYQWCNDRASDGCWGLTEAIACIDVIDIMQSTPFWRRKKKWKEIEPFLVANYVNPTNEKIKEYLMKRDICPENTKEDTTQ